MCHNQVLQPRTVGEGECASLAESKAHTKSGESTTGKDICSKLSLGGDDLDQSIVESMTSKDFDILTQRRSSRPLKTMMPHVIRNENPAYDDLESTLVMDSTGLFDALDNDLPQDDWKSALEVPIIEEIMRRAMCRPRLCPHNRNAAGAMTKFKGVHSEPLFMLLRTGMYTLKGEKIRVGSATDWNSTTTQSERSQSRDGTHIFSSRAMRAGPCRLWCLSSVP